MNNTVDESTLIPTMRTDSRFSRVEVYILYSKHFRQELKQMDKRESKLLIILLKGTLEKNNAKNIETFILPDEGILFGFIINMENFERILNGLKQVGGRCITSIESGVSTIPVVFI